MRITKDEVVAIGKRAIEARFLGVTQGRAFAAFMLTDDTGRSQLDKSVGRADLAEVIPLQKFVIVTGKW